VNVHAEQKAHLLETQVLENADTIEQLRQERSLLVADHKELQKRFSEISEVRDHSKDGGFIYIV
jgi:myosin protein heavy chain